MPYHPSIFKQINAKTVGKSTLKTHGSHSASGLDACECTRIIIHFNQTSIELCKTIAKLFYTIASKVLPPENLTAYNKNPGGTTHWYRRGSEKNNWQNNHPTDAILLIDAENAFNSLNRELAPKNVKTLCPALLHALANSYKHPSNLYVKNTVLTSVEGTSQWLFTKLR